MKTLCFTGHRQINGQYAGPGHDALSQHLVGVIERAIGFGVVNFISGMALGVDTLGAEAVLYAKAHGYEDINLIGAMPFPSQNSRWNANSQQRHANIWASCDVQKVCFEDINRTKSKEAQWKEVAWKMQGRNVWMVDQSNVVVAVWNGVKKGGTWNCLKYAFEVAKKRDMTILVIHPTLLTETWYASPEKAVAT